LLDWEPALRFSKKASREWLEKNMDKYFEHAFLIRALEDDRPIGEISLSIVLLPMLVFGRRLGQSYGTMIILSFYGVDLPSLDVFERIRSYEKCGFVVGAGSAMAAAGMHLHGHSKTG
jgi:hypothetical protein